MVRRIRIALVTHSFDCGGIERSIAYLASYLPAERFDPIIVSLTRNGAAARWLTRAVPVLQLHKPPQNDPRVVARLARVFTQHRADIVHSHNWGTLVETAVARRLSGTPVHVHSERGTVLGTLDRTTWRATARAMAMRAVLAQVDAVVSNAAATAARVHHACGYPMHRILIIPNGLPCPLVASNGTREELRHRVRQQLRIAPGAFVVGTVARLDPVKHLTMLIEAIARVRDREPRVEAVILGDGPERGRLERRARDLAVADRVHFVGYQADTGPYYAAMDAYANTSVSEGMSQAIVEAMSVGLPIVATPAGDTPRLIGGSRPCGLLVPHGDVDRLADALYRLATDPERRQQLGEAALARYQSAHDLRTMIRRYVELYERLVASN